MTSTLDKNLVVTPSSYVVDLLSAVVT